MKLRSLIALAIALLCAPAMAQTNQGSSPLTGPKGGTNNAFMQFSGPASSIKTFTLPNASDTINTLAAVQTITGAKTYAASKLLLGGSTSGAGTLNAPAVASTYVWTLPAATDTLVGKATTDTLTNKTFDTAATGNSLSINGLAATANTGTGAVARAAGPTFTTPALGVATATSINGNIWTAGTGTLAIGAGKTATISNTLTIVGTDSSTVTLGAGGTVAYLSNTLNAFAATTSAQLASVISDETGSGALVFGTSPTLVTPTIGVATASSINKVAFTAPATGATLTIPDGVTLTGPAASGTAMTLGNAETVAGVKSFNDGTIVAKGSTSGTTTIKAGAIAGTTTVTLPVATDTLVGKATTDTLTNKTFDTAGAGNSLSINGVAATANTGTGSVVRATSPTITTPTIASIVNTGTLTLPTSTDTLVGRATTDTLTNKTLTSPAITTPTGIVKGDVGLGNVDNTSDATKWAATATLTNKSYNTQGTGNVFTLNGAAFGTATQATAALNAMVGDSGAGGTKGLVPAAGAGDAAAGKFLKADGTFAVPPGTGGGGGLSDEVRRNILLDSIYLSKALGDTRRAVLTWATGFKAATDALRGIDAANSSAYDTTASASNGYVAPTSAGIDANALIVLHMDGADNGTSFTDSATAPNTVTATGSAVTHTTSFGTPKFGTASGKFPASGGLTIPDSAALRPGTGDFTIDFWVRYNGTGSSLVLFDKGNNGANALTIDIDGSASPKIRVNTNASLGLTETTGTATGTWVHKAIVRSGGTVTIYSNGVANGSASIATNISSTSVIGIGVRSDGSSLPLNGNLDELRYSNVARWTTTFTSPTVAYAAGSNNMTLVTTAQTADASVSNGRALIEFDNSATPTLNTDLTVEVTCNGGTNWASASLSSVTAYSQGGRKVAETVDQACTSGTSFAARVKTLNNKNVPIYGASLTVH